MTRGGAYLRVGLLILSAAGLVIAAVFFLTGEELHEGAKFETYFSESVQGLNVGAPVKFRGVMLGQVTAIGLVSAAYGRGMAEEPVRQATYRLVYVRFTIDPKRVGELPDTQAAIKTGLRTRLASQGLTGLAYIELDFVDPETHPAASVPWQPHEDYIPSVPSTLLEVQTAVEQFLNRLNDVDLAKITTDLDGLLVDVRGALAQADIQRLGASLNGVLDELRVAIRDADLPGLSAEFRDTARSVRDIVRGRDVHVLLANAAAASARLPPLLDQIESLTKQASLGTAEVRQALGPLLRDARQAVANLRDTADTLRRYPSSVLLGGAPPRP